METLQCRSGIYFFSSNAYRYSDEDRHKDLVRGLAWSKGQLYSCGWDQQIFVHDISSTATKF